ncbi:MAG: solute carrier family 26 protein [Saprospiraceae bacterium]|nr:solute carrier family 26 protein [Saprospiraceae bacterium]
MKLEQLVPSVSWLRSYNRKWFPGDLSAGLTVGVMLIPQGMAYAMIAGVPPIYGLYASTIPIIIYALLGTSRQLAVGPVAMVSLLTAAGVSVLAEAGSETYLQLAILLALMVGLIQFLLGVFRLGFLVNFLSHPVISGFTSAAAILIGLSQVKHLLGVDLPRSHHVHEILIALFQKLGDIHFSTFLIGLGGIAIILLSRRIHKGIPGQLLAVLFGIMSILLFDLDQAGVSVLGEVPAGFPAFELPLWNADLIIKLIPTSLAIALVSFMESIAVAKAIQAKHRNYKVIPNQELRALGFANIVGSFFQSFTVTGGFSRTAVNDQAGAKSGLASIISAALIIITLLFFTHLFYSLPQAILASVILVAVSGLIDFKEARYLWRVNREDFVMLVVTFLATLTLGIELGVLIGVILSLSMVIYRTSIPHVAILGKVPGTTLYRNVSRFKNLEEREDLLIFRFDAQLYFANLNYFKEGIEAQAQKKGENLKFILIDAESINYIDSSALHLIEEMIEEYKRRNILVYFSAVKGPVRDAMALSGIVEKIGENHFFMDNQSVWDYIHVHGDLGDNPDPRKHYTMQTNK